MGGLRSRRKGLRGEYLLRDHLRAMGYEAHRVPSSGAAEGFKGDVVASKDGVSLVLEMKCRKQTFKTLYKEYYSNKLPGDNVWRFNVAGKCVAIGTDLEAVKSPGSSYFGDIPHSLLKIGNRLIKLSELRGTAEILVLKDNNRPLLFVRYWL